MNLIWIGGKKFCKICDGLRIVKLGNDGNWHCLECGAVIIIAKAERGKV